MDQDSTGSSKKYITIVVVVVIILLGWWLFSSGSAPTPIDNTLPTGVSANTLPANSDPTSVLQTSPTDASDATIDQDMASIISEFNGLTTDTATVDAGLNDTPVTQAQ